MVDSKFQELTECLYRQLVEHQQIDSISFQLQHEISAQDYLALEDQLIFLGLNLKTKNNVSSLASKIDIIDVNTLKITLKELNIRTPIQYFFSTTSTNIQAKQSSSEIICIADHQESGYGRNSKKWISPLGQCIAISIKHRFALKLQQLSGLNIAIGVAIMKTFKKFKQHQLGLKWPNDILGKTGKVAGIMIEATGNSKQCVDVVIGIGINWNINQKLFKSVQQDCMNAEVTSCNRTQFIQELIVQLYKIFNQFTQHQLQNIKEEWHQYDIYLNQRVQLVHNDSIRIGNYVGIDSTGALQLENDDKIETIINGEVSLRPLVKVD
jgi:BirA family biotin operon repressor/biotin-[acetyl-CoA-carboxylase] ligase